MRIAFLCTSGLENASPNGRWLPIARELARHGHEPHLLLLHPTFDRMPKSERDFTLDGVRVAHVAQMHVYGLPGERRYFSSAELAAVSWRAARALSREAIRLKPDILHICKPQPINGLGGWWSARALRKPFFVDCDDYEAEANRTGNTAQRRVIQWWEDNLPRRGAGVTVNTRFLQQRCQLHDVAHDRIFYVPNGGDPIGETTIGALPPEVQAMRGAPTVAYVGTMSTVAHGVDLLLAAFAIVHQRMPEARLLMVGDGDDRLTLQASAQQLGITPAVHWTGRVPTQMAPAYFSVASCSVDPVYDTPAARGRSPLKIVESLMAGVPVVTSDVGDRRETLMGWMDAAAAGLLVRPGDPDALADGLLQLLRDPQQAAQASQGALERRERFRWARLAATWAKAYELDGPAL